MLDMPEEILYHDGVRQSRRIVEPWPLLEEHIGGARG